MAYENPRLVQARDLIQNGKYRDARLILLSLDDPLAKRWLKRIDDILESESTNSPIRLIGEQGSRDNVNHSDEPASQQVHSSQPLARTSRPETHIIVTTTDLNQTRYTVISPVYFQLSNVGVFSTSLSRLKKQYGDEIASMRKSGQLTDRGTDLRTFVYGEWLFDKTDFEVSFYIALREIQKRAKLLDADAVVGMRQDIDMLSGGAQYFCVQMYGTAVRFL